MGLRHACAADACTQPRWGSLRVADVTQGSASDGATLGWWTESRWDSREWPCGERRHEMIDDLHRTTPTALSQLAQGCGACLPRRTRRRQARATLGEGDDDLF